MRATSVSALLVAAMLALPSAAAADVVGTPGKLVGLRDVNPASDYFPLLHGSAWVDEGKGTVTEYRWGGSVCPGQTLSEEEIANLARALDNPKLRIIPLHKNGQGDNICLTHFLLVVKSIVDDVEAAPLP